MKDATGNNPAPGCHGEVLVWPLGRAPAMLMEVDNIDFFLEQEYQHQLCRVCCPGSPPAPDTPEQRPPGLAGNVRIVVNAVQSPILLQPLPLQLEPFNQALPAVQGNRVPRIVQKWIVLWAIYESCAIKASEGGGNGDLTAVEISKDDVVECLQRNGKNDAFYTGRELGSGDTHLSVLKRDHYIRSGSGIGMYSIKHLGVKKIEGG